MDNFVRIHSTIFQLVYKWQLICTWQKTFKFKSMDRRDIIKSMMLLPFAEKAASGNVFLKPPEIAQRGPGAGLYASLGVRPVINGRGTITIIGGSRILPEVEKAMREA